MGTGIVKNQSEDKMLKGNDGIMRIPHAGNVRKVGTHRHTKQQEQAQNMSTSELFGAAVSIQIARVQGTCVGTL
jgi:hypothetical protein